MTILLSTEGLCKRFGGVDAVSNISIEIAESEIRAIIGPNGSGKSTFLNLLSAVYRPNAGSISFRGRSLAGLSPHAVTRRGISRTFQNLRLFRELTVLENVMVGCDWKSSDNFLDSIIRSRNFTRETAKVQQEARKACSRVGIGSLVESVAGALSYGQQRRVEIARAIVADPKLILLDEPVAGMNTAEAKELGQELVELRRQGLTILLIEHNVRFVMNLADRISVFDYGQKIFEGNPEEVRKEPRVIEAYLGADDGPP